MAMKLLALGAFFLAFTHSFTTFLITIRKHWLMVPILLCAIVFGWLINVHFISRGWGIEGVAIAEGLLSAFYFFLLSVICLKRIATWNDALKIYLMLAGLFVYFAAILFGADHLTHNITDLLIRGAAQFSFFLACMSPVFILGEKQTAIVSTAVQMIYGKVRNMKG